MITSKNTIERRGQEIKSHSDLHEDRNICASYVFASEGAQNPNKLNHEDHPHQS